jgi:hypothetical protein
MYTSEIEQSLIFLLQLNNKKGGYCYPPFKNKETIKIILLLHIQHL